MGKGSKRTALIMMVVCVVTGLAALAVGIVAIAKNEYIITLAMLLVMIWQIFIFRKWRKGL